METIVRALFGSHMYGLNTKNSDKDYKGIFFPSSRDVILNRVPKVQRISEGPEHAKNTAADMDEDSYSLHYFIELACQGQSAALDLLHGDGEIVTSPTWQFLKANRHRFYTKSMNAFVGYARKQAAKYGVKGSRLESVRQALALLTTKGDKILRSFWLELWEDEHCEFDPSRDCWVVCGKALCLSAKASEYVPTLKKFYDNYGDRARLAERNEGVDWKAVSHALRAGYQVRHILRSGTFSYPLPETDFLMKVKLGELHYKNTVGPALDNLMFQLEQLAKDSTLPAHADRNFWDDWLVNVIRERMNRDL